MQSTTDTAMSPSTVEAGSRGAADSESLPFDARVAQHNVRRALDRWCRDHDFATSGNQQLAEEAIRQVWSPQRRLSVRPWSGRLPTRTRLPRFLKRWPPEWRYRVATLERGGVSRTEAERRIRIEHRAQAQPKPATGNGAAIEPPSPVCGGSRPLKYTVSKGWVSIGPPSDFRVQDRGPVRRHASAWLPI
jgi:hypothetical protein